MHRSRRGRQPTRSYTERWNFIQAAVASDTDECIEWPFTRNAAGYGLHGSDMAHRVVLALVEPEPPRPAGRPSYYWHAAHKPVVCHNPPCINPRHLYWATAKQNTADRHLDGTLPSKLNNELVLAIRADSERPATQVAADYGVAPHVIRSIRTGRTWRHLLDESPLEQVTRTTSLGAQETAPATASPHDTAKWRGPAKGTAGGWPKFGHQATPPPTW